MKECAICHADGSDHILDDGRDVHFDCYYRQYAAINDEASNERFLDLAAKYGLHGLEDKLRKMPSTVTAEGKRKLNSYNAYNRKWPFDAKKGIAKLEDVEEFLQSTAPSVQDQLIMREEQDRFLASLTGKQRFVVEKRNEGYKPLEIAKMLGLEHSGRVRWHLHAARQKLRDLLNQK